MILLAWIFPYKFFDKMTKQMLTCNNILKKMHDIHVRQLDKRLWTFVHFFEPGTKKLPSEV